MALGIDGDGDGAITWGELRSRHEVIEAWLAARLTFTSGGEDCALRPIEHLVDRHTDGAYAVVRFTVVCPTAGRGLEVRYDLLFDLDPTHRGLLTADLGGEVVTEVLSPQHRTVLLGGSGEAAGRGFPGFFVLGGEHLLLGFDHLLFLLVLLLPPAFRPTVDGRRTAWQLAGILSAFTLAHGISLAAATTGLVEIPARLVESGIALTILLAAIDNLRPWLPGPRVLTVFAFGLVHGLGFAGTLAPLELPTLSLMQALLGFNLGIEVAQLLVAVVFLTSARALEGVGMVPRHALGAGSLFAVAVAGPWFVARALGAA